MSGHTLYGKTKVCYTEVAEFTNFQGIGRDPLYKRFDSVNAVVEKCIPAEYQDFLAHPIYSDDDDCISWYVKTWTTEPAAYKELSGAEFERYRIIMERTLAEYRRVCNTLTGEDRQIMEGALRFIDEDLLFCYDGKVVLVGWGMAVDTNQHVVKGRVMHNLAIKTKVRCQFLPGEHGSLADSLDCFRSFAKGAELNANELPVVVPEENYVFKSWVPDPTGLKVTEPMIFVAQYEYVKPQEPEKVTLRFRTEEGGTIIGQSDFLMDKGSSLYGGYVPKVQVAEGYRFEGWTIDPTSVLNADTTIMAMISKEEVKVPPPVKVPWYKRLWDWFLKHGWKWLLGLLLLLLLLLLMRDCSCSHVPFLGIGDDDLELIDGDDGFDDIGGDDGLIGGVPGDNPGGIYNPDDPYRAVPTPDPYRGVLPPNQGVLPPIDKNPVIEPGNPDVIADRLNILMENENKSIMDLARAFKEEYPSRKYEVIYYDDVVKRMQIKVPRRERERLKAEIPAKFAPEFNLFVFDEALFEGAYTPNDPAVSNASKAWYLDAVNAFEAWDITKGSEDIIVAIVDNGFDLRHSELKSKVFKPYNVWLHSDAVSPQRVDHGTHVAGTAVAIADNNKGISGIAPRCKFMPIQVANQYGLMTTTSVLDGVLYAVYQGADVINISLGQQFSSLSGVDESFQRQLIHDHFKEEERLWMEISRIAARHKATIVVAAGNDGVLAGIDALHRPENVIVVSAVDKNLSSLRRANFSNYGDYSTISAPGVEVYSTVGADHYETMQGTSMAAPVVTGAVALMKSVNKDLTSGQIISILQQTGLPVNGNVGKLIQIDKALMTVKGGHVDVPTPTPSGGDVQILLSWENYNDLDLKCSDPSGEIISYSNKRSRSGGQLEIDMNVEYPSSRNPIENIYWPTGGAPQGTYNVYVTYYSKHENVPEVPYKVKVMYGSRTEEYNGVLKLQSEVDHVCTFTLGTPSAGSGSARPGSSNTESALEQERARLRAELERVENELNRIRNSRGSYGN